MSRQPLIVLVLALLLGAGAAQAQIYELFDPAAVHSYEPSLSISIEAGGFLDKDDDGRLDAEEPITWIIDHDSAMAIVVGDAPSLDVNVDLGSFTDVPFSNIGEDIVVDADGSETVTTGDRQIVGPSGTFEEIRHNDPRLHDPLTRGGMGYDLGAVVERLDPQRMAVYIHDEDDAWVAPGAWRIWDPRALDYTSPEPSDPVVGLDRQAGRLIQIGDFDFGRALSGPLPVDEETAFGWVDGNGNGVFDTGETGVLDADGDGTASPFDLTLTPSLRKGAFEQLGIFDPENGIELRFRHPGESKLAYYDNDGDNGWSSDDHFYIDLDGSGTVSAGDIRFANNEVGVLAAGTRVASGDPDESRPLIRIPLGTTSLAFSDNDAQAGYNGGDNLYWLQGLGIHGARQEDIRVGPFGPVEHDLPTFGDIGLSRVEVGDEDTRTPYSAPIPEARIGVTSGTFVLDGNGNGIAEEGESFFDGNGLGGALGEGHPATCEPLQDARLRVVDSRAWFDGGGQQIPTDDDPEPFRDDGRGQSMNLFEVRMSGANPALVGQRFEGGPSVGDVELGPSPTEDPKPCKVVKKKSPGIGLVGAVAILGGAVAVARRRR